MDTLFEAAWHVAQMPQWFGWTMIGAATSTLTFLAGLHLGRD